MGSTVEIILENYNESCSPGETLVGKVKCFFTSQKSLKVIKIRFTGQAKTQWTVEHRKHHERYWAEEVYFDSEYNLIECENDDFIRLSAGTHEYPFSYILPPALPATFKGDYGDITYTIKVIVERPWKFDMNGEFVLNVVSPLDLNYTPVIKEPFSQSAEETAVSCYCIDGGSVSFSVSLPTTAYAVGQKIDIGTYVQNMSNTTIESVLYEIIRINEFIVHHSSTREKSTHQVIATTAAGSIGTHAEKSWTSFLEVPRKGFVNLLPCSIISATYRLKVKIVLPSTYKNLKIDCPLTLGTVPLDGINTNMTGAPIPSGTIALNQSTPFLQNADISFSSCGNAYGILGSYPQPMAPPSYEESEHLNQSLAKNN